MSDIHNLANGVSFEDYFLDDLEQSDAPSADYEPCDPYRGVGNITMASLVPTGDPNTQQGADAVAGHSDDQVGTVSKVEQMDQFQGQWDEHQGESEEGQEEMHDSTRPAKRIKLGAARATKELDTMRQPATNPTANSSGAPSISNRPSICPSPTSTASVDSHQDTGDLRCPVPGCGKTFFSKGNVNRHVKTHDKVKDWTCQICGKFISEERWVRRHQQNPNYKECHQAWLAGLLPGSNGYVPPSYVPSSGQFMGPSYGSSYVGVKNRATRNGGIVFDASSMQKQSSAAPYVGHANDLHTPLPYASPYPRTAPPNQEGQVCAGLGYAYHANRTPAGQAFVTGGPSPDLRTGSQQQPYTGREQRINGSHISGHGNALLPAYVRHHFDSKSLYITDYKANPHIQSTVWTSEATRQSQEGLHTGFHAGQSLSSGYLTEPKNFNNTESSRRPDQYQSGFQNSKGPGPSQTGFFTPSNANSFYIQTDGLPVASNPVSVFGFDSDLVPSGNPSFVSNNYGSDSDLVFGSESLSSFTFAPSIRSHPSLSDNGPETLPSLPPPDNQTFAPHFSSDFAMHPRTGSFSAGHSLISRRSSQKIVDMKDFTWLSDDLNR